LIVQTILETADFLLYSSMYDSLQGCRHIHGDWIVRRALNAKQNPTVVYLPMSNDEDHGMSQRETSEAFFRLFQRGVALGLRPSVHYWRQDLGRREIRQIFQELETCAVLILGGGSSALGLTRYCGLGRTGFGEPARFKRLLETRHAQGKLTVGFSAGAEQLSTSLMGTLEYEDRLQPGLGLIQEIMVSVHYSPERADVLGRAQKLHPGCQIFALPNETGLGICQRTRADGKVEQWIEVIIDPSVDPSKPYITHVDANGRTWEHSHGVRIKRVIDPATRQQHIIFCPPNSA
jgi:hypothetical protein